jgi:hypothetical protein
MKPASGVAFVHVGVAADASASPLRRPPLPLEDGGKQHCARPPGLSGHPGRSLSARRFATLTPGDLMHLRQTGFDRVRVAPWGERDCWRQPGSGVRPVRGNRPPRSASTHAAGVIPSKGVGPTCRQEPCGAPLQGPARGGPQPFGHRPARCVASPGRRLGRGVARASSRFRAESTS